MVDENESAAYNLARTGATYNTIAQPGYLLLSGPDQIPFLQRQTTNDLRGLLPGQVIATVLTSPAARILDVLAVFFNSEPKSDPTLGVLTLPGRGERTAHYLTSRIFFNDNVKIQNLSHEVTQIDVDGPLAGQKLHENGLAALPEIDHILSSHAGSTDVRIIGRQGTFDSGYRFLALAESAHQLKAWLDSIGINACTPDVYNLQRIEAGLPGEKDELTEEFTPLETNLLRFISDNKGCYTGQEVLARQITYDKITRKLVGLKTDAVTQVGDTILVDGKAAGRVTSAANSPRLGPIALAVLKRPYFEPGTSVTIETAQSRIKGSVVDLPFS